MYPIPHPSNNLVLRAPPGMRDCIDIQATRHPDRIDTLWQLSPQERAAIAAGEPVWLSVWGSSQPPVSLTVAGVPMAEPELQPREEPSGEPPPRRIRLAGWSMERGMDFWTEFKNHPRIHRFIAEPEFLNMADALAKLDPAWMLYGAEVWIVGSDQLRSLPEMDQISKCILEFKAHAKRMRWSYRFVTVDQLKEGRWPE